MMSRGHIVSLCDGCLMPDFRMGKCTVFVEPASQWENGECWGRCESLAELLTRLEEMAQYNRSRGNDHSARRLEVEIESWKELAEYA